MAEEKNEIAEETEPTYQLTVFANLHGPEPYRAMDPVLSDLEIAVLNSNTKTAHRRKIDVVIPQIRQAFLDCVKNRRKREIAQQKYWANRKSPESSAFKTGRSNKSIKTMIKYIIEDERAPSYSDNEDCEIKVFLKEKNPELTHPRDKKIKGLVTFDFFRATFCNGTDAVYYLTDLQRNLEKVLKNQR